MWIAVEGPHKKFINSRLVHDLYVTYRSGSKMWAVVASYNSVDVVVETRPSETTATQFLNALVVKLENEK